MWKREVMAPIKRRPLPSSGQRFLRCAPTQQAEAEQTGAALRARSKACGLGGRVCLTTSEGADKQTGEVALLLLFRGSRGDRKERGEQIAKTASASGLKPIVCGSFDSEAVADGDGQLPTESERGGTVEEMTERANLVAVSAVQLCERAVRSPVAMNCVRRNVDESGLMRGVAALQHSSAQLDHGLACKGSLSDVACEATPIRQLCAFELLHG